MRKEDISRLIANLKTRNIQGIYLETLDEAKAYLMSLIPVASKVGIGHSATLIKMELVKALIERGNTVYDKTLAAGKEEGKQLKRKAMLADWFVAGSNAVSLEGHIVNVDHSGNRAAAMLFGPEKVVVVIGVNKLAATLEDAIYRVKNTAAPQNAKRAGFNPPCVELGKCIDCRSTERVCNSLVIIEGQSEPERLKVLIVNEEAGY